jgi:hypothetical protein
VPAASLRELIPSDVPRSWMRNGYSALFMSEAGRTAVLQLHKDGSEQVNNDRF